MQEPLDAVNGACFLMCIYFLDILPLLLLVNTRLRSVRNIFHARICWSRACAELYPVIYSPFIFVPIVA